ncbi:MAG TPA: ATP-binding protein [Gemmataceae bacterium]|nr:ATP-binding protein [Gemmataceae bacterium]
MSTTLHKTLNRNVADLITLGPEVEDFLARHAVSSKTVGKVRVVLEEIMINLINHSTGSATGLIDVRLDVEPARVVVLIEDDGTPFDPRSAPEFDRSLPLEQRRAGGMGIQLVRSLVEELDYKCLSGRNRLRLVIAQP